MLLTINETKEVKEILTFVPGDASELTAEIILGASNLTINSDDGTIHLDQDDFDWWTEYLTNYVADEEELARLREKYGSEKVNAIVDDESLRNNYNDYEEHHANYQRLFARINDELAK